MTPAMVEQLDAGLARDGDMTARDLGRDERDMPGDGDGGVLAQPPALEYGDPPLCQLSRIMSDRKAL